MSTGKRGKLEVPGGYLLTVMVPGGNGKLEVPGGCRLTAEIGWRYLVDIY